MCSQPIELMWAKSKYEVSADWHKKRTLGETYQALMNAWYGGQSTNLAARRFFEFAAITKEQCGKWIFSCEYKMDIYIRKKSICLTGNVPNVRCDDSVDYSDTDSDESDIDFKVEYKLEKQLAGDV